MKNQYVADVNDYRKYGLLRTLSGNGKIRTGVCWMLTQNDEGRDGQFRNYLYLPKKFRNFDPPLFDILKLVSAGERNVRHIESENVIPNAVFHNDILSDVKEDRKHYFADMIDSFQRADLIFFDPDNGLEIGSLPCGRKRSSKYLYWSEVKDTFSSGKSILVYQHFIRENRYNFIKRLSSDFCSLLNVQEVLAFNTSNVVFFLISQPKHAQYFKERSDVLKEKWHKEIW